MKGIKVESVEEAVNMAENLKSSGRTFLFRGQEKDWPIKSSFVRIKPEYQDINLQKLARFKGWVKHTPGLENIAANADAIIAVAQHYGLPTNFVDFTTQPKIAGFFASEKAGSTASADLACILCLDVQDFIEYWKYVPKRYPQPKFLEISVPDLWRLQTQQGRFLICPYDNVEHIYAFDRIYFPNTHVLQDIKQEEVYPHRKSQLEVLLDQYFMNELLIERERTWTFEGVTQVEIENPVEGFEPDVFPNGLPEHKSWSDSALQPWFELRAELFCEARTNVNFTICISNQLNAVDLIKDVSEQLSHDLFMLDGIRSKLVGWNIQIASGYKLPLDFDSQLSGKLARLWDGLRRLPYSNDDICYGIGLCVALAVALKGDFQNIDNQHWEQAVNQCLSNPIYLEFGAEDGSYSRGYVALSSLFSAVRSDLYTFMADKWKEQLEKNIHGILQTAWTPQKTFDYELLCPLFAREIAPYQVLARNMAVFYSPARLHSLGLP
jgi:hypothetical protein